MDLALRIRQLRPVFGVSKGALRIPLHAPAIFRNERTKVLAKPAAGILIFLVSILLAQAAHKNSREAGRQDWENKHDPGINTWETVLASRGLKPVTQEREFLARTRFLATSENTARVWISLDYPCLALIDPVNGVPSKLFCRPSPKAKGGTSERNIKTAWQPIGSGWSGLETALSRLDRPDPVSTAPRHSEKRDPHEVRY